MAAQGTDPLVAGLWGGPGILREGRGLSWWEGRTDEPEEFQ